MNPFTTAQVGSYSHNEYMKSIHWGEYKETISAVTYPSVKNKNACQEVPLQNDNDKVKLNFSNLLGDTKITLNQNN